MILFPSFHYKEFLRFEDVELLYCLWAASCKIVNIFTCKYFYYTVIHELNLSLIENWFYVNDWLIRIVNDLKDCRAGDKKN